MGTEYVESETTSLLMVKQIDNGLVLSTSHYCDWATDLVIRE